jgi:Tfp pilus assembly protein PilO
MTKFLDNLNLRPHERRVVIVVAVIVFVVLNAWFVWPHFNDASKSLAAINKGRLDWTNRYDKIQLDTRKGGLKDQIVDLTKEEGASIEGSKEIQLQRTVQQKAPQFGVMVLNYNEIPSTSSGKTNEFFEERSMRIGVQTGESNLVNFLYDIGNDSSMIRVREIHLKPTDQNRYRLNGDVLLTANFQKKAAPLVAPVVAPNQRAAAASIPRPTMVSGSKKSPPK